MIAAVQQPMTFEEFLAWDDGTGRDFDLIDGFPMPIQYPNAKHEDVADTLCYKLVEHCQILHLPYVPKRLKYVRLPQNPVTERDESRKADIVVFTQTEWERLRNSTSSAAAYVPPPMVIEVVNTNWRVDYQTKLDEYEALGIAEYWVVDYAGLGGVRFIGSPKQPTLTIYGLQDGEYQPALFRADERILSPTFPQLQLTANEIFRPGR